MIRGMTSPLGLRSQSRRRRREVRAGVLALLAVASLAGCLHEASQHCSNGGVCPAGSQCTDTGSAQLCIRLTCGNGVVDPGEICDDGNNTSGDGCPADCSDPCGDGVLDPGEICDDGNRIDGDGCASDCRALDGIALVSPPAVRFTAEEGDVPPATVTVSMRLMQRGSVQVEGALPGWLAVRADDSTPYTAAFTLQILDTSVAGRRSTGVRFVTHHDDRTADTYDLPVTYDVAPSGLTMQVSPAAMDFTAASGGALPPPERVDVAFSGAAIAVVSAPSWITVSAPPRVESPAAFSIAVSTTALTGGRTLEGDVVFATTRGTVQRRAAVHVRYQIAASLTDIHFVAPYVGIAGRGGTLHVRGTGFRSSGATVAVGLGDVILAPVVPDSDTQITVDYPPLPEGRYAVTLDHSGVAPARPELVIVAPAPVAYQAIDTQVAWDRIVYDAERRTIYGANTAAQQIERVVYAGGAWSKLAPVAIPRLTDIALAPDGRSLIVLDEAAINSISLGDGMSPPEMLVRLISSPFCGLFLRQLAAANNGKLLVTSGLHDCSGDTTPYLFDLVTRSQETFDPRYFNDDGDVTGSADGSRIYVTDSFRTTIFESLSSTLAISRDFPTSGNRIPISVSTDAARVMVDGYAYSRSLVRLGSVPYFRNGTVVSRDATRVVVYRYETAGDRLEVYSLTDPVPSDGQYPLESTVMLPDPALGRGENLYVHVAMATSPDDGVVFVAGDNKLLVVPMP